MNSINQVWPFTESGEGAFNHRGTAKRNRLRVQGLIARRKCLSQRQLAQTTGLQPSTISNIIRELKSWGLIREGDALNSKRSGPKETELEMVPSAAWSVGVHLFSTGYHVALANTMGHILFKKTIHSGASIETNLNELPGKISKLADNLSLNIDRLGGIGVTLPGVVDNESGTVLVSRSLKIESYPLRETLQKHMSCPIWVERDVVSGAYAEHYSGVARNHPSFIYIIMRSIPGAADTVGLALVVNEKVFRGCHYAAGEVDRNFLSNCQFEQGVSARMQDPTNADQFYQAFGTSIGSIINLLDIGCVVLNCNDPGFTQKHYHDLLTSIHKSLIPVPGRNIELMTSGMNIDGIVAGAALLAMHRYLATKVTSSNKSCP